MRVFECVCESAKRGELNECKSWWRKIKNIGRFVGVRLLLRHRLSHTHINPHLHLTLL
jgi:hypothetical protein